jgi:hypothetical protein
MVDAGAGCVENNVHFLSKTTVYLLVGDLYLEEAAQVLTVNTLAQHTILHLTQHTMKVVVMTLLSGRLDYIAIPRSLKAPS